MAGTNFTKPCTKTLADLCRLRAGGRANDLMLSVNCDRLDRPEDKCFSCLPSISLSLAVWRSARRSSILPLRLIPFHFMCISRILNEPCFIALQRGRLSCFASVHVHCLSEILLRLDFEHRLVRVEHPSIKPQILPISFLLNFPLPMSFHTYYP